MTSSLITHATEAPLETIRSRVAQIQNRPDLTVERANQIIDQMNEFGFGRFLLKNSGINGFWTQYMVLHPRRGRVTGLNSDGVPHSELEKWLLDQAPAFQATQERFEIFQEVIQQFLNRSQNENLKLASVPCGLMDDLLSLNTGSAELVGIDLDINSLSEAKENAKKHGKAATFVCTDAWQLELRNEFDLITSNGLNIYEPNDERVERLYQEFYEALKEGGILVTSFLTPPPLIDPQSEWNLQKLNPEDLWLQKVIFADILQAKWQAFRSSDLTHQQLKAAGFTEIEIHYDEARLFPTAVAKKPYSTKSRSFP